MAKKEKGSPAENKGEKDVKFKGKSKEAEHEIWKQRETQMEKPEHSKGDWLQSRTQKGREALNGNWRMSCISVDLEAKEPMLMIIFGGGGGRGQNKLS